MSSLETASFGNRRNEARSRMTHRRDSASAGAALIVNTQSRHGERLLATARRALEGGGVQLSAVWPSEHPSRLGAIVRRALAARHNPIIVGGGDGSISTAAGILANSDSVLGVLPLGTANDFARTLAIPPDLQSACAVIAGGNTIAVDLGQCSDRYYLNLASIGLASDVATILPGWLKKISGKLAYPLATVVAVTRFEPFDITLTFPDADRQAVTCRHVIQFGVGNGHFYGGGMAVAPNASPRSGHLDVYAIKLQRWSQMIGVARCLKAGEHVYEQGVFYAQVKSVNVSVSRSIPLDIDGEVVDETTCRFTVARTALRVLAPSQHCAPVA
jgi:diacylglycerol kinase (ATP)